MMCPKCGLPSKVVDSRRQTNRSRVWRHRVCRRCDLSWKTYETMATDPTPTTVGQDIDDSPLGMTPENSVESDPTPPQGPPSRVAPPP